MKSLRGSFAILLLAASAVLASSLASADAISTGGPVVQGGQTPGIRIAVMPFAGSMQTRSGRALSEILTSRLAARPLGRVVGPENHEGLPEGQPAASTVREYAREQQVDSVVTGYLGAGGGEGDDGALRVEVRSSHSGAPSFEHRVSISNPQELEAQLDDLAAVILGDLGYQPPGQTPLAKEAPADDGEAFTIAGFENDQPIAINSDELEVVETGEDRQLVFRRNVKVVQGEITLLANELEAFYEKGDSRPRRLVATGRVRVAQGDRNARCDQAIYLRDARVLRCSGKAELREGCDRVRGEEIRFDLATERVKVLGAASVLIQAEGEDGECMEGEAG